MNKRIRELAEQAGIVFWEISGDVDWRQANREHLEEFAELIVKECVSQIYSVTIDNPTDDWDQGYDSGLQQAAETIKQHFGVEE